MRRLVVQQFVSVDGFAAGPDGDLEFINRSGDDPTGGPLVEDQLAFIESLDLILLGANTYRMFAAYWPEQTVETQAVADALNETPKVVFSGTLENAPWGDWDDALVVAGPARDEVRRLKDEPGGDMVVWGSLMLAESLERDALVDEYRLYVCPVVLGAGRPLFGDGTPTRWMRLVEAKTYRGVVALRYDVERGA